jgi:hypothetical protein
MQTLKSPVVFEGYTDIVTNAVAEFLVPEANVDPRLADKDRTQ